MSQEPLTAKYRPQTFAQVAGQEAIKSILSRAAATDRIAPAYLFSGTRGVGKTTIARIFAKAINCETSPASEPCNACRFCEQITRGASVDVMEIDGASNTGVDNVRKLRENVAYAPLDCRYKVIIIDEAHMLSRSAFNALLKTLEEPPGHVVFIMATTEPEKFPQTIISRCQHYVFKRLSQHDLASHLTWLLEQESLPFEPTAVNLVARRGAGSVRDAMSLLSQVLALGKQRLEVKDVREVLGLADQELYLNLVRALAAQDLVAINGVLGDVLDKGLDLIFFLRELVLCWRNLFLLAQVGDQAVPLIDLPGEEIAAWKKCVPLFRPAHIHACWQMTLEGQRRVQTSLEPGMDLEMLLLNLAYLPGLLPLGKVASSSGVPKGAEAPASARPSYPSSAPVAAPSSAAPASVVPSSPSSMSSQERARSASPVPETVASVREAHPDLGQAPAAGGDSADIPRDWQGFVRYCLAKPKEDGQSFIALKQAHGTVEGNRVRIQCTSNFLYEKFSGRQSAVLLQKMAVEFFGSQTELVLVPPEGKKYVTATEARAQALSDPLVKGVMETFGAQIVDVQPRKDESSS